MRRCREKGKTGVGSFGRNSKTERPKNRTNQTNQKFVMMESASHPPLLKGGAASAIYFENSVH